MEMCVKDSETRLKGSFWFYLEVWSSKFILTVMDFIFFSVMDFNSVNKNKNPLVPRDMNN